MLGAIERELKVLEEGPSRLNSIESPLETLVQLSHWAGETPEQARQRCEVLLNWLSHGKDDRAEDWCDALTCCRKLLHRPRFCEALLLVSKRLPTFAREVLPQIESLQRLHLTAELDAVEDEMPFPEGELGGLLVCFPRLEASVAALGEWQRRAGEAPAIPSGIRELLGREEKWQREAEFLRARLAKEPHAHLQTRLANLEARLESGVADVEVELAGALETAVEAAISGALRSLVTRALRGRLRLLCGPIAEALEWNDDWANALLIACELDSNRKWATKLLRGQSQNSSGWQRHIPANQKWLCEFAASGKNREVFESEYRAQIGEWELWIERDALQILQMGNRFSTCLSRGGCNSHSTIANALDANKLVVYARRDGHIQARQLWVVTDDGKLGGFHIYANLSEAARKKSGLSEAFFEFARRFGHECGLELLEFKEYVDIEIPEICGARWYDDGLVSWHNLKDAGEKPASGAPGAASSPVVNIKEQPLNSRCSQKRNLSRPHQSKSRVVEVGSGW